MFVYKDQAEIPTERETHENTCKSFLRLFVDFVVVVDTRDRLGLKSAVLNVELTDAYEFGVFYTKARTRTHTQHTQRMRERTCKERERVKDACSGMT